MPESEDIHETANQLVAMYSREYNVVFPPLNMPLMLFQFVRQLALPCKPSFPIFFGFYPH
jgi:RNA polymerase I-specific transcription initiation factor RRN7